MLQNLDNKKQLLSGYIPTMSDKIKNHMNYRRKTIISNRKSDLSSIGQRAMGSLNINIPKNEDFFEESPRNSLVSPKNTTFKSLK